MTHVLKDDAKTPYGQLARLTEFSGIDISENDDNNKVIVSVATIVDGKSITRYILNIIL